MNKKIINDIFQGYIDKFDFVNNKEHKEYYKWQVCKEFPTLMNRALYASKEEFTDSLREVKKCTYNIIDSYTQPFSGLVDFSIEDPETVRSMFKDLYVNDNGDLKIRMEKIADFFVRSQLLLDKYCSGSFLYKQNSHSVSSYLFLNDPENHYMYKASHCRAFFDCIECYSSNWGTGDNIDLRAFHEVCDEVLNQIKNHKELLITNQGRYDNRLGINPNSMHKDENKHILLFDVIYCASTYELYNGISFTKRNAKEKNLFIERQKKAEDIRVQFDSVKKDYDKLSEALDIFTDMIKKGDEIIHKKFGNGIVESINEKYIVAKYNLREIKLDLSTALSGGFIKADKDGFDSKIEEYKDVLKRSNSIPKNMDYMLRQMDEYREYLQ